MIDNSGFEKIIQQIKQKSENTPSRYLNPNHQIDQIPNNYKPQSQKIDLGTEFQIIRLGGLKQQLSQRLERDLTDLTDLHMEVQAVFRKYLINNNGPINQHQTGQSTLRKLVKRLNIRGENHTENQRKILQ